MFLTGPYFSRSSLEGLSLFYIGRWPCKLTSLIYIQGTSGTSMPQLSMKAFSPLFPLKRRGESCQASRDKNKLAFEGLVSFPTLKALSHFPSCPFEYFFFVPSLGSIRLFQELWLRQENSWYRTLSNCHSGYSSSPLCENISSAHELSKLNLCTK